MDIYTFWHDPGHGWLEVPSCDLKELGLTHGVSRYSYQKGERVFLEEDCDATAFFDAYQSRYGQPPTCRDEYDDAGFVRTLPSYIP